MGADAAGTSVRATILARRALRNSGKRAMAMAERGVDDRVEKAPESDGWQAKAPAPQRADAAR
jgi:hypothetical protein